MHIGIEMLTEASGRKSREAITVSREQEESKSKTMRLERHIALVKERINAYNAENFRRRAVDMHD
jgi:hypothetical protein